VNEVLHALELQGLKDFDGTQSPSYRTRVVTDRIPTACHFHSLNQVETNNQEVWRITLSFYPAQQALPLINIGPKDTKCLGLMDC